MKRNLPKVYKNKINKPLNNNSKVFYSSKDNNINRSYTSIDELFKQNEVYRLNTFISLKDGSNLNKIIIGRSIKHLITIDNELIPIEDITSIKKGN